MARKVIIDCNPGIDEAVALCLALFAPELDVVGITATSGNIPSEHASRNVQAILEALDPPRIPRIGVAGAAQNDSGFRNFRFQGMDGLGNSNLPVSELHRQHPSEKIICDEVHNAPDEVMILTLGPLTNIARAFQLDPELSMAIHSLYITGGSVNLGGNITACSEFNIFCDPDAAHQIFRIPLTKYLLPLDVTESLTFDYSFLTDLPKEGSSVGSLLHKILPYLYKTFRQELGQESVYLNATIATMALLEPELFTTKEMVAEVETAGEITQGATIFDRRHNRISLPNIEVATEVKAEKIIESIHNRLVEATKHVTG
ncbi:MAG: nucleoside hydrolase [Pirellulaceae bacterium]|nr:nucleoside hydrolase [Pirellulaceae bacterium]